MQTPIVNYIIRSFLQRTVPPVLTAQLLIRDWPASTSNIPVLDPVDPWLNKPQNLSRHPLQTITPQCICYSLSAEIQQWVKSVLDSFVKRLPTFSFSAAMGCSMSKGTSLRPEKLMSSAYSISMGMPMFEIGGFGLVECSRADIKAAACQVASEQHW